MAGPEHGHERAVRVPGDGAEDEGDLYWGHHPPEAPSPRGDQGGQDTRHRQRPRRYSGIHSALEQIMEEFIIRRARSSLNIWTEAAVAYCSGGGGGGGREGVNTPIFLNADII